MLLSDGHTLIPASYAQTLSTGPPQRIKFGADPSAPDLHLGHCVVLFALRKLQRLGHRVLFVIGDFTAAIGDPTGKSETRKPLDPATITRNATTYQNQVFKVLQRDQTEVVYNSAWLSSLTSKDMLTLTAHYTVARMLERDDFKQRFIGEQAIGIHELIYPLLQGYDSVHLNNDLEIGGSDQRFNLLVGRTLQRAYGCSAEQAILTLPLLEGTDGVKKMSKSLNNHIGILDTPTDMFGKLMSIPDALILRYFTLLTDTSPAELAQMNADMTADRVNPRDLKIKLAKTLLGFFHSPAASEAAEAEFKAVFSQKKRPDTMPSLPLTHPATLASTVMDNRLLPSKKELSRLLSQGAITYNDHKLASPHYLLTHDGVLKIGKRRFYHVQVSQ